MSKFVRFLKEDLQASLTHAFRSASGESLRVIYCGPPFSVLEELFEEVVPQGENLPVTVEDSIIHIPVFLLDPQCTDPLNLKSSRCSQSYLTKVRTASGCDAFIALKDTTESVSRSLVTSATRIGVADGIENLDDWIDNHFVKNILDKIVSGYFPGGRDNGDAVRILQTALQEAWVLDDRFLDKRHVWGIVRRLFDLKEKEGDAMVEFLAIVGLPPCGSPEDFGTKAHTEVLVRLADLMESSGFGSAFETLIERAGEEMTPHLIELKEHILSRCSTPQEFLRSPLLNYSPCSHSGKLIFPEWWRALTLDVWDKILDTGVVAPLSGLGVKCINELVPQVKGMPTLVLTKPVFEITLPADVGELEVEVSRASGQRNLDNLATFTVGVSLVWEDDKEIPSHDRYLRYRFTADGYKPVTFNVIVLDEYATGLAIYSRSASKTTPFKLNRKAKDNRNRNIERYDSELRVHGVGSHQIDIYHGQSVEIGSKATGYDVSSEQGEEVIRPINRSNEHHAVCVLETDEECHYDFTARLPGNDQEVAFRIWIEADDHTPTGARSEFDRLVLEHMSAASLVKANARVEVVPSRLSDLMIWAMGSPYSYLPVAIGPDYLDHWREPEWKQRPTYSRHSFMMDPRPEASDLSPPATYITARKAMMGLLNPEGSGERTPIELQRLGELMGRDDFKEVLGAYIESYIEWLESDYRNAVWSDLITLHAIESEGDTLQPNPYACLLSPLHPLKLVWQCEAQLILKRALDNHARCPAASMLNPSSFPDCMELPCTTATGRSSRQLFVSVASDSDYWSVLWNTDRISEIGSKESNAVFHSAFGLEIQGLSTGFSVQQVVRSLNEIERLSSGKSTLRIALASDTTGSSSCNEGIETWCRSSLGEEGDEWFPAGGNSLQVFDLRDRELQPEQASLASLVNGVGGSVSWFDKADDTESVNSDLTIIAHLGTSNPGFQVQNMRSPVDRSLLTRCRIRKQLSASGGAFIAESRVGKFPVGVEESTAWRLGRCADLLEIRCRESFDSYLFAPKLPTLDKSLMRARYCAVSSSNVDAACFFGSAEKAYLWDYDLPSYGRKSGENSGYFLLARESHSMVRAVQSACKVIAPTSMIGNEKVTPMLNEVSRRGMPTLKRLTVGGAASLGELGMLIALRLLQSEFEESPVGPGIAPVSDNDRVLNLVIPVDPFKNHFEDLRMAIERKRGERPDLIVVSIVFQGGEAKKAKITPVEVKARKSVMSNSERSSALDQTKSFTELLLKIQELGAKHELWGVAWRSLTSSWLDYAFRVYGQLDQFLNRENWAGIHEQVMSAVLSGEMEWSIDRRGRLIVIDASNTSKPVDVDGDGFSETLNLSHPDGFAVINSEHVAILKGIRDVIGDWDFAPDMEDNDSGSNDANALARAPKVPAVPVAKLPDEASAEKVVPNPVVAGETDPVDGSDGKSKGDVANEADSKSGLRFCVGEVSETFNKKDVFFFPANTQLNQLNVGIVGDLGTGKTQLIQALIYQLRARPEQNRGVAPRILIFDYKKDYSKKEFVEATGARVVQPFDIPLSVFDTRDSLNPQRAWLDRSKFFIDVLSKIFPGMGAPQAYKIKEAVKTAYAGAKMSGGSFPTINDVFGAYADECGDKIDSPFSIMSDLVDGGYFVSDASKAIPFSEFLDGVVVIDLGAVGQDDRTKNMLVVIFLNLFYEHMLTIKKQPFIGNDPQLRFVDAMLLVDEADNILKYEFDVLKKVLLQGREFGVGVILASQYLSHFKTQHENYLEPLLTWLVHKVPNVTIKELEALGLANVDSSTVDRIKSLACHECMYKTFDVHGEFIRATPFYKLASD
jgi:DNA phosphorothioation-dependent restriction protein DptH